MDQKQLPTAIVHVGRAALAQLQTRLQRLEPSGLARVNLDLAQCAKAGQVLLERIHEPEIKARMDLMAPQVFQSDQVETIDLSAKALVYLKKRIKSADDQANQSALPEPLLIEAIALKNQMFLRIEYAMNSSGVSSDMKRRRTEKRGSVDLAQDLFRLEEIFRKHLGRLPVAVQAQAIAEMRQASRLARKILESVSMQDSFRWREEASRTFTVFCRAYDHVQQAAKLATLGMTDIPEFLPLATAVHAQLRSSLPAVPNEAANDRAVPPTMH